MARTKPVAQLNDWKLFQLNPSRWSLRWIDSKGKHRITFKAPNLETAIVEAHQVRENDTQKGKKYSPNRQAKSSHPERIRISDALIRSAQNRDWTEYYRKTDAAYCRYFLTWIDHLGYHFWDELRLEHIESYMSYLRQQGKKTQTVQHYLKPAKRTAAWVSSNFMVANICQALTVPRRRVDEADNRILWLHQGLNFLDWLARPKPCDCSSRCECVKRQKSYDRFIPVVSLQLLCGLRLKEALSIRWADIEDGAIRVSGQKNVYSVRIIPFPQMVGYILRNWGDPCDFVVRPYADWRNYSRGLRKALMRWNAELGQMPPKNLRKTLFREAKYNDWYGWALEAYMGHSVTGMLDVTRRHYVGDHAEDLLPVFRKSVLQEIEKAITSWDSPADTLLLPGPQKSQVVQGLFKVYDFECLTKKKAPQGRFVKPA